MGRERIVRSRVVANRLFPDGQDGRGDTYSYINVTKVVRLADKDGVVWKLSVRVCAISMGLKEPLYKSKGVKWRDGVKLPIHGQEKTRAQEESRSKYLEEKMVAHENADYSDSDEEWADSQLALYDNVSCIFIYDIRLGSQENSEQKKLRGMFWNILLKSIEGSVFEGK